MIWVGPEQARRAHTTTRALRARNCPERARDCRQPLPVGQSEAGGAGENAGWPKPAGGGDRTHTILRSLDFESSASASSATPAIASEAQANSLVCQLKRSRRMTYAAAFNQASSGSLNPRGGPRISRKIKAARIESRERSAFRHKESAAWGAVVAFSAMTEVAASNFAAAISVCS